MNLSKSKYCRGTQCEKMLWLEKYKPECATPLDNVVVFTNGNKVGELAKQLFGDRIDIEYNQDLTTMIESTAEALKNDKCVITEASFNYNGNFCSVDILVKNGDNYEIYEVKSSTVLSPIYLDDVSYQHFVLTGLGLNVTKTCVVHINKSYVRNGDLDIHQLFKIEDVTETVLEKQEEVKNRIQHINEYMENTEEPEQDINTGCFSPYDCVFFPYCSRHLTKPNVFDVKGMTQDKKLDYYHKGVSSFDDLLKEKRLNSKYKEQIEFELYGKEDKVELVKIRDFLKTLTYPLYFLDFESYQTPIPPYDNMSPYEQIPFQYSLHYYEDDKSELKHKEFLADPGEDPRRKLAEALVRDIPENVCVVAYNMLFEKGIIKKLAQIYPDLSEHLMNIHGNFIDLMIPFKNRDYYSKDMKGSFSIKYVLPALFPGDPSLDYHNLEGVHNGAEASATYSSLQDHTLEEQEEIKKHMLEYCGLDTYAMVKIYKKLKDL